MRPEQKARDPFDGMRSSCGWTMQDYKAAEFSAGRSIGPLKSGATVKDEQHPQLNLIRDHIATSPRLEPENLELSR